MFCGKCGCVMENEAQFCRQCGAKRLDEVVSMPSFSATEADRIGSPWKGPVLVCFVIVLAVLGAACFISVPYFAGASDYTGGTDAWSEENSYPDTGYYVFTQTFDIDGSWQITASTYDDVGNIVYFRDSVTNFWWSPMDTYALQQEDGGYVLYVSPYNGTTQIFDVELEDNDHIRLVNRNGSTVSMTRVE